MAGQRSLPLLSGRPFRKRAPKELLKINPLQSQRKGSVFLFVDEFSNYNDGDIAFKTIQLLTRLGYEVILPEHRESARTYLSKGLLKKARRIIQDNIDLLYGKVSQEVPLLGIEPSAILGFRDEYPDLAGAERQDMARELANHALLVEEFLNHEINQGNILKEQFTDQSKKILLHGHCQQKAVASTEPTLRLLNFPENYTAEEIPSGCCGMAGSFGYEKEHYEVSMKVGELVLFPAVRAASSDVLICAPGTSCRHQIKDGTKRQALHPVEILYDALK